MSERDTPLSLIWTAHHVRIYDYNRYGTLCFSGLAEAFPDVDVTKALAQERRRLTIMIFLEEALAPPANVEDDR